MQRKNNRPAIPQMLNIQLTIFNEERRLPALKRDLIGKETYAIRNPYSAIK